MLKDDCDWIMLGNVVSFDYEHDFMYIEMSVTCNVWFLCVWDVDAIVMEWLENLGNAKENFKELSLKTKKGVILPRITYMCNKLDMCVGFY